MATRVVNVPKALHMKVKAEAARTGISIQEWVRVALEKALGALETK